MTATNVKPLTEEDGENTAAAENKSPTAFRTISEVADELGVQQHVLRFWETKFSQIKPLKRGGGRRYYRPEDVLLLKRIHDLLYSEGYTIKGAQKLLKGQGRQQIAKQQIVASKAPEARPIAKAQGVVVPSAAVNSSSVQQSQKRGLSGSQKEALEDMLTDLKEMRDIIRAGSTT